MRFLFFALLLTVGMMSCTSTEPEPEQPQQSQQNQEEQQEQATPRGGADFETTLKATIKAMKNKNVTGLDGYIDEGRGLYCVFSTQGAYSESMNYQSSKEMFEYSEATSEYEANPVKFLLDYLYNVNMDELEIIEKDLFGIESCGFNEKGVFVDSNESDIKLLTDIYNMNSERDGLTIESEALLTLADAQNAVSKTVYISDGETTYTMYFTEKGGNWSLTIMDMRDCDT